jgi:hypothetical protein
MELIICYYYDFLKLKSTLIVRSLPVQGTSRILSRILLFLRIHVLLSVVVLRLLQTLGDKIFDLRMVERYRNK